MKNTEKTNTTKPSTTNVCICGRRVTRPRPEKCDACSRRVRAQQEEYENAYE